MNRRTPAVIVCCCGWRGPLSSHVACPGCGGDVHARLTKPRVTWMRVVESGGKADRMPRNMRAWFARTGLMVNEEAPPAGSRSGVAHNRRPALKLTELGARVYAAAVQR